MCIVFIKNPEFQAMSVLWYSSPVLCMNSFITAFSLNCLSRRCYWGILYALTLFKQWQDRLGEEVKECGNFHYPNKLVHFLWIEFNRILHNINYLQQSYTGSNWTECLKSWCLVIMYEDNF